MTEEEYKAEIERLTQLVIETEDGFKQTLDELGDCHCKVKWLTELHAKAEALATGLVKELDTYNRMSFFQRLWWAFTKRMP